MSLELVLNGRKHYKGLKVNSQYLSTVNLWLATICRQGTFDIRSEMHPPGTTCDQYPYCNVC